MRIVGWGAPQGHARFCDAGGATTCAGRRCSTLASGPRSAPGPSSLPPPDPRSLPQVTEPQPLHPAALPGTGPSSGRLPGKSRSGAWGWWPCPPARVSGSGAGQLHPFPIPLGPWVLGREFLPRPPGCGAGDCSSQPTPGTRSPGGCDGPAGGGSRRLAPLTSSREWGVAGGQLLRPLGEEARLRLVLGTGRCAQQTRCLKGRTLPLPGLAQGSGMVHPETHQTCPA